MNARLKVLHIADPIRIRSAAIIKTITRPKGTVFVLTERHITKPTRMNTRIEVLRIVEPIRISSAATIKNITRPTKTEFLLNKKNIVTQRKIIPIHRISERNRKPFTKHQIPRFAFCKAYPNDQTSG